MKTAALTIVVLLLLSACATREASERREEHQAVRDFIALRGLEESDEIRSANADSWTNIDFRFIVYKARKSQYLVEFDRRCYELGDRSRIVPDKRWQRNVIRARVETLRGCQIKAIYPLTEAEATELENLGEAPGS